MTDDAGYGDFGSYGARDVKTPNIDGIGPMLFNLRADIGEHRNLIGQRPELAARLFSPLDVWEADVDGEAKKRN